MDKKHAIGIDLGGTKIEIAAIDLADRYGEILWSHRVATPDNYNALIRTLRELATLAVSQGFDFTKIGIGTPGSRHPQTGVMRNSNTQYINGKDLYTDLCHALPCTVNMANDADCFALAEAKFGVGQDHSRVFGVIIGTGCGGGFVIDGQPQIGPNALAGEWGHMQLPWPWPGEKQLIATAPPKCWCGREACMELFVSGSGVSRQFKLDYNRDATCEEIANLAEQGDKDAISAIYMLSSHLASGLAQLAQILDPDIIVMGGGVSNIDPLYHMINQKLPKYIFGGYAGFKVVKHKLGDSAGVRGAALL